MTSPAPLRRLLAAGLIVVFAALPALVAGSRLGAPPAPGEWQRVQAGVDGGGGSDLAGMFYGMALADVSAPLPEPGSAAGERLLAQARLGQLAGVLALSLLAYLVAMVAFGRQKALLTAACLAVTGPVLQQGQVLRPETPAALFGLFALLFLQLLAERLRRPYGRSAGSGPLLAAALALIAATATALAVLALPAYGIYLLVPGAAMAAAVLQLGGQFVASMRRRSWIHWPTRALARRLWPWVLASLLSLLLTIALLGQGLQVPADQLPPTPSAVLLLPGGAWLRWPLTAVLLLGAVALVLRLAVRGGRRPGAELLLTLHCGVLLLHHLAAGDGTDALPAALPAAVLLAEGLVFVLLLAVARGRRRSPA